MFTFSRDTKLEEITNGEEYLKILEGRGNEDDDRRANFLRGGKREKRREDESGSLSSVNRC